MEIPEGILLIDKPKGITSFDVIRKLRTMLGVRKMGHAGTLDPLASGLMVIGVEAGTKKLHDLVGLDKEYLADVRLGESRTTGDMEGTVVETKDVDGVPAADVEAALAGMVGVLRLPVSAYSAMKKGGVPFYKLARKAEEKGERIMDVPIRDMEVRSAVLEGISCKDTRCVLTIRFMVGSGTYVRSLAEELGTRLGYPATLQDLRRTKVGEFSIGDAKMI